MATSGVVGLVRDRTPDLATPAGPTIRPEPPEPPAAPCHHCLHVLDPDHAACCHCRVVATWRELMQ
jgi:hypothetical protein